VVGFLASMSTGATTVKKLELPERTMGVTIPEMTATLVDGCPVNARCLVASTRVNVVAHLGGCMDQLGPVSYALIVDRESSRVTAYVSALEFPNRGSLTALCARLKTEEFSFAVPGFSPDRVQVQFVGNDD